MKHLLHDYEVQGAVAVTVWMSMPADKRHRRKHIAIFRLSSSLFASPVFVLKPVSLSLQFPLESALNSLGFCLFVLDICQSSASFRF